MTSLHDIPGNHVDTGALDLHLAATATEKETVFVAPFSLTLTSVKLEPSAAASGANTNTTHYNLLDGGAVGVGTTEIGNVDFTSGIDLVANTGQELIGAAGVGTNANLDKGDRLILQREKVGTGLLIPKGAIVVTYKAR